MYSSYLTICDIGYSPDFKEQASTLWQFFIRTGQVHAIELSFVFITAVRRFIIIDLQLDNDYKELSTSEQYLMAYFKGTTVTQGESIVTYLDGLLPSSVHLQTINITDRFIYQLFCVFEIKHCTSTRTTIYDQ